jgi:hypothetical protein
VYSGKDLLTHERVAIKCVDLTGRTGGERAKLIEEVNVLRRVSAAKSEHIVNLLGDEV